MDLPQDSPNVRDMQAEIEDLKARLRIAEDQNRQLRHKQGTSFMELPFELRMLIWESAIPDQRVLRICEVPNTRDDDHEPGEPGLTFFCSARPPVLFHICRESRKVALAHFKPFFEKKTSQDEIARPIYFRPKVDILYIDADRGPGAISPIYPEVTEVESIAIPASEDPWFNGRFLGLKRLFLVTALEEPWPSNRCCATIELSPNPAGKQQELNWTDWISKYGRNIANVQRVKSVVGKLVHNNCYLD